MDQYGRFALSSSANRNLLDPSVSRYLIRSAENLVYPDDHEFGVFLSHDIDILNHPAAVQAIKALHGTRQFRLLLNTMNKVLNPAWNVKSIMNIESEYQATSTFFVMAQTSSDDDFNYYAEDLQTDIARITDSGCEIALHGGRRAPLSQMVVEQEKKRLEAVVGSTVLGYRSHFLRFRVPVSWQILERAGFSYDSTLGFAESVGFRNGMCHPYQPFDLERRSIMKLWEIPLVVMDTTLFGYMGLRLHEAWEVLKALLDTVHSNKGVITILWHNNTFMRPEKMRLYRRILSYGKSKNAWMTTGEQLYKWWRKKDFFKGLF